MPAKEISIDKRFQSYRYLKTGLGIRETSRLLSISRCGVKYNQERIEETNLLKNRKYADRCTLQSESAKIIDELLQSNPAINKKKIQQNLKECGHMLTVRQISYRIKLLGYCWKKAKKCQVIREENRLLRCDFHQCTVRLGKKTVFCYVKEGKEIPAVGQLAHGKSVHVWGGISWNGATDILIWDGTHRMKSGFYVANMLPKIIEAGEKLFDGDYQLIQDSSSVHVSAESRDAFDEANILLFPLPPQSPDFNPIEFIWRDMKNFIK
uniref:Tc1-like transposase DDE domain-containing protein n=1 Tax=Panagrolaimus davidi TaxID=227884 RepID=A0A914PVQ8_9BILA